MALGCDADIVIRLSDPDTRGKLRIVAPELENTVAPDSGPGLLRPGRQRSDNLAVAFKPD